VLDVPYLPQSELLCGGAAVAMVERYWGRRGVYAEDFTGLVRAEEGGIRTTDLAAAAKGRGWETRAFDGTPELVQRSLADGAPVVALIEVAPRRYHYVVLLGWSAGRVVFHDPARAPSTTMDEARFLARWNGGERWAMILRPDASTSAPSADSPAAAVPVDSMPCAPWLDQALDAAALDRLDEAERLLGEAKRACPTEALVTRELAGVRFKQGRFADATRLAIQYLAQAPNDAHGWQLLAASRYVAGDRDGALQAWNRVGRPTVDLIRIEGVRGIRFREIAEAMGVPPGTVLTSSRLALARRRIAELPALSRSAVEYQPAEGGIVELRAAVAERPVVGSSTRLLVAGGLRALAQSEVRLEVATPTGAGELWTATWRWESARPEAGIRLDLPARLGFRGVLGIEGSWERYRFALDSAMTGGLEEERRTALLSFGGWITPGIRPAVSLRFERWSRTRANLAAAVATELRAAGDRLALSLTGEYALALGTHSSYARGGTRAIWTSSTGLARFSWSLRAGVDLASVHAPLGAWPIAGANLSLVIPLRAHPETSDGRLLGTNVGRVLAHGGASADLPIRRIGPIVVATGAFLDGAEVSKSADGSGKDRFYLDAGAGLRVGIANGHLGVLRVDVARGLLDRRSAVSVGVHRSWPPWRNDSR
jgi:hypothetical protein